MAYNTASPVSKQSYSKKSKYCIACANDKPQAIKNQRVTSKKQKVRSKK